MKRLIAALLTLCLAAGMAAWAFTAAGTFATAEMAETVAPESVAAPSGDSGSAGGTGETSSGDVSQSATAAPEATPAPENGDGSTGGTVSDTPGVVNAEATDTPAVTDGTETTETPAVSDTTEATETPAVSDGAEATETPAPTDEADPYLAPVAETPAVEPDVGSGPVWIAEGAHRRYGSLNDLLPVAMVSGATLVFASTEVFAVTGYAIGDLSAVTYGVDRDALGEYADGRRVIISAIGPSGQMDSGTTYLWVGLPGSVPSPGDSLGDDLTLPDEGDVQETEIMVDASGYTAGAACTPTFTLHAYPALTEGQTFAVAADDSAPQAIGGDAFTPAASGVYTFAVMDNAGTVLATSISYEVLYGVADPTETAAPTETPTDEAPLTPDDIVGEVSLSDAIGEPEVLEINVQAFDYAEGVPSSVTPSFELSGAPAEGGYTYGISINGGGAVPLRGDTFAETDSGEYTYVFYILDADQAIVASSAVYHVVLDFSTAQQTGDAWMASGKGRIYGSLSSLLRQASGGATIYLLTSKVQAVSGSAALSSVHIAADPDRYGADYGVVISDVNPDGERMEGITFVWLGVEVSGLTMASEMLTEATFTVNGLTIGSRSLTGGMWVNGHEAVNFSITDSDPSHTYVYEISVNGGASYTAFSDGGTLGGLGLSTGDSASLSFRVTVAGDEANTVTYPALPGVIAVQYDNTAPTLVCRATDNGTLTFYAGDTGSGFGSEKNVTFNATASPIPWTARLSAQGGGTYTYSVRYDRPGRIAAGTLGVRDQAGNVAVWNEDIQIVIQGGSSRGGTGGAGGGRGGGRTVYHSASTYENVTVYGGVDLIVETGEMEVLTIGGEALPLRLEDGSGGEAELFTAQLYTWGDGNQASSEGTGDAADETDETAADTLVLTASDSASQGDGHTWVFNGSVYKQLSASGIRYLMFSDGEHTVALSTAGFAAGVRYNLYRMAGLASGAFDYAVQMDAQGGFSLSVTVDGQTSALSGDTQSEFYYYNVVSGTLDLLDKPFVQAEGQNAAA